MRHDPAGASIVIMLRSLKLYGMAQAVDDLVAQGAPAFEAATPMLSQLLKAEMDRRSLETEESLRYVIAHQVQEQAELDELRALVRKTLDEPVTERENF